LSTDAHERRLATLEQQAEARPSGSSVVADVTTAQPITGRGVGYKLFTAALIPSMSRGDMQRVYRLLKEAREEANRYAALRAKRETIRLEAPPYSILGRAA
jgi:hypothetical protein